MKVIPQVHRRSVPALGSGGIELKQKCSCLFVVVVIVVVFFSFFYFFLFVVDFVIH